MTSLRHVSLLLAAMLGCAGPAPMPPATYAPGVSGGALSGRLEVIVVDEATHEVIDSTVEVVRVDGAVEIAQRGRGPFVFEEAGLASRATVRVLDVARPQAVVGVGAERIVIAIARPDVRSASGTVRGADVVGASDVVVGALSPVRFLRTDTIERARPVACARGADGCRFSIDDAATTSSAVIATLRDGTGSAVAFGLATIDAAGDASIDLATPAARAPRIDLAIASPATPPAGLEAVVGVPGLATPSGVAFLDQTPAGATIGVPELAGSIADGSWWLVAEAAPSFADRSTRSVVLQRGLRAAEDIGAWPAWLAPPGASSDAGEIVLTPADGAAVHVIDWLSPTGAVLASALVLDPSLPIAFTPAVGATAVRVRAIDARGSAEAFDPELAERDVVRFSETVLTL